MLLEQKGFASGQIVCYVGSIGKNQGLPETAASMQHWPGDAVFVLIGPASEEVKRGIFSAAAAAGAANRVLLLGAKPHSEALALTAGATLGVSLIQPNSLNLIYSAGAVNKRFEYMAMGVPQVTNTGPGVPELIEHNHCGVCADPHSPEAIGAVVNRLLSNQALLREMGERGRKLHLECYNYQMQFQSILERIVGWCGDRSI
jgi:hypothetical protein